MTMAPRIKLNSPAVAALLKSDAMLAICQDEAEAIAARAGEGFVVNVEVGANRVRAEVVADTEDAKRAEAVDRRLTNAVGGN